MNNVGTPLVKADFFPSKGTSAKTVFSEVAISTEQTLSNLNLINKDSLTKKLLSDSQLTFEEKLQALIEPFAQEDMHVKGVLSSGLQGVLPEEREQLQQLLSILNKKSGYLSLPENVKGKETAVQRQTIDNSSAMNEFFKTEDETIDLSKEESKPTLNVYNKLEEEKNTENKILLEKMGDGLLDQVSALIGSVNVSTVSAADSRTLLNLLKQWKSLEKLPGNTGELEQLINRATTESNRAELTVWAKLSDAYQKRLDMAHSSKYQAQASVTTSDISKWVKQALARYPGTEAGETNHVVSQTLASNPMSKVEHYAIHLQHTGNMESEEQKLLQEFQRIINSSKFIQSNGSIEMILKLKPANLGEVLVKMVDLHGELAVKIIVSSQTAKEALEGNLTQLRHMFSPSQVLIEKQEPGVQMQESYQSESEQGEAREQSHAEEETRDQNEINPDEERESVSFADLFTAEKEQVN